MGNDSKLPMVDFGELPVWHGAQGSRGWRCAPFALTVDDTGLVRLLSPETDSHTVKGYGADGYQFPTSPPGSSEWGNRLAEQSLRGLASVVGRLDGLDVMEIGGGTLYCARQMLERLGARTVTLIDPSADETPDDDRLHVRREYFREETPVARQPSIIVSFNTLEHVSDPASFLRAAHQHLADDGRLFVKVPDCGHGLECGDLGICTHEHLSYFTGASLERMLRTAGFVRTADANYRGALQVLARKAPTEQVAPNTERLAEFKRAVDSHVERIKAYAKAHRGGRVAFVGASVGLSNLLHVSCIGELLDIDIYDGDALKTGKFIPGHNAPIRLTEDAHLESHETVFITPVNFFDEIRAALARRPGLASTRILSLFGDDGWGQV